MAVGLLDALAPIAQAEQLLLECVLDDEAWTLGLLKAGEVIGCISTHADEVPGCAVDPLGEMAYVFVASQDFCTRFFVNGVGKDALIKAPAVVSGKPDSLHRRWLREHFGLGEGEYPCHIVAENHALYGAALAGMAYAIVPRLQAKQDLEKGLLTVS